MQYLAAGRTVSPTLAAKLFGCQLLLTGEPLCEDSNAIVVSLTRILGRSAGRDKS